MKPKRPGMLPFWSHRSTVGPLRAGVNSCNVTLEKQFIPKAKASAIKKTLTLLMRLFCETGSNLPRAR